MSKVTVYDGLESFEVNGDENIQEKLRAVLGGKFFAVTFLKANGEVRNMSGRLDVKKYVKGTGHGIPDHKNVTVYVSELKQYRKFNIERLKEISCGDVKVIGEAA